MMLDNEQTGRRHVQPAMSKGAIWLFIKKGNISWLAFVWLNKKEADIFWMISKPAGYWVSEQ